jgi:hypothetical protein
VKRLASTLSGHPDHTDDGSDENNLIVILDSKEDDRQMGHNHRMQADDAHSGHNHRRHILEHYDGSSYDASPLFDKTISVESLAEGATGNATAITAARNDWSCESD